MFFIEIALERKSICVVAAARFEIIFEWLFHILVLRSNAEVLEHVRQELKGWPFDWVAVPALEHYLKEDEK